VWEAYAEGRVLLGAGVSDAVFTTGETGGASRHTLTEAEMPEHTHPFINEIYPTPVLNETTFAGLRGAPVIAAPSPVDNRSGGGQPHNNLPPYRVVYIWRRVA
jgi:microcystin-dependent protein